MLGYLVALQETSWTPWARAARRVDAGRRIRLGPAARFASTASTYASERSRNSRASADEDAALVADEDLLRHGARPEIRLDRDPRPYLLRRDFLRTCRTAR